MPYNVAIAGATGNLGSEVTKVFLSEYRPPFTRVIALVRNPSADAAKALAAAGAELRQIDESDLSASYEDALTGVDVLVSVLSRVSVDFHNAVFDAALKSGVKLYIPSEFGLDHRVDSFPGYQHWVWERKREHLDRALEVGKGKIKTIAVFTGLFLDGALVSYFGFDQENHVYTSLGSAETAFTLTSKADIGRAVASFSVVALADQTRVPDILRISGTRTNYKEVAEVVQRVRRELGSTDQTEITVKSEDLVVYREDARKKYLADPEKGTVLPHLRIAIAQGDVDFASDNANEIANPGQKAWKWKSVEEFVRSVKGKL